MEYYFLPSKGKINKGNVGTKVNYKISSGKIKPQSSYDCICCEKKAKEYHHVDYSKPFILIPICRKCHAKIHQKRRNYYTSIHIHQKVDFTHLNAL